MENDENQSKPLVISQQIHNSKTLNIKNMNLQLTHLISNIMISDNILRRKTEKVFVDPSNEVK